MMSGHGTNPILFNKKNKEWTSRTLANPPIPITSDNSSFLSYPPTLLKVDVICVSHLEIMQCFSNPCVIGEGLVASYFYYYYFFIIIVVVIIIIVISFYFIIIIVIIIIVVSFYLTLLVLYYYTILLYYYTSILLVLYYYIISIFYLIISILRFYVTYL